MTSAEVEQTLHQAKEIYEWHGPYISSTCTGAEYLRHAEQRDMFAILAARLAYLADKAPTHDDLVSLAERYVEMIGREDDPVAAVVHSDR